MDRCQAAVVTFSLVMNNPNFHHHQLLVLDFPHLFHEAHDSIDYIAFFGIMGIIICLWAVSMTKGKEYYYIICINRVNFVIIFYTEHVILLHIT